MARGGPRINAGRPPGIIETIPRRRTAKPPRPDVIATVRSQMDRWSEANLVPEMVNLYEHSQDSRLKLEILRTFASYSLGLPHASGSLEVSSRMDEAFERLAADLAQSKNRAVPVVQGPGRLSPPDAPLISGPAGGEDDGGEDDGNPD